MYCHLLWLSLCNLYLVIMVGKKHNNNIFTYYIDGALHILKQKHTIEQEKNSFTESK